MHPLHPQQAFSERCFNGITFPDKKPAACKARVGARSFIPYQYILLSGRKKAGASCGLSSLEARKRECPARSPATTWAVLGLFLHLLPPGCAQFKIIPVRWSFLCFPDEIIPHLINLAARKFHLRFSLIFPLLETIPSLIPVKGCVWVMAVKPLVDLCQFTPREGSDCLFGFVIWVVIEVLAGFYWS